MNFSILLKFRNANPQKQPSKPYPKHIFLKEFMALFATLPWENRFGIGFPLFGFCDHFTYSPGVP